MVKKRYLLTHGSSSDNSLEKSNQKTNSPLRLQNLNVSHLKGRALAWWNRRHQRMHLHSRQPNILRLHQRLYLSESNKEDPGY